MRKKSVYVWSLMTALMMSACSDQHENTGSENTSRLEFTVNFGEAIKSRAAQSTAIPVTSWDNINQVQFFLYDENDPNKVVRYSAIADPTSSSGSIKDFVYTDVPVGTYTLVAVANVLADQDNVSTYISNAATTWNSYNVRSKEIANLTVGYKAGSFPSFADPTLTDPTAGCRAFTAPSEVYMAYESNVVVASGQTTQLTTPLPLKREVSLLRVRLNVDDPDAGVDNSTNGDGGVDWTQSASVLIYCLPNHIGLSSGDAGGSSTTSTETNIIVDTRAWNTADPTTGYNPTMINQGDFKRWQDIVVFANNGARSNTTATEAHADQQYYIVVTALGKKGHVLADNRVLDVDKRIYWSGLIKEAFLPNRIREVNLTLKSGGDDGELPPRPSKQGTLEITVSDPAPWDDNILDVNVEL